MAPVSRRRGIHHVAPRGWSQRGFGALTRMCSGWTNVIFTKTSLPANGFVIFVIAVAVIVAVSHLRYHEVDEIKAGVSEISANVAFSANSIRVRRSSWRSRPLNLEGYSQQSVRCLNSVSLSTPGGAH